MSTHALFALFKGERIKWRRSWATVAAVLTPLCQAGFLFLMFWFSEIQADQLGPGFIVWYRINFLAWNLIFLPVTVALVCLLSWDQEEEAYAWKHLLLQPVPRRTHYLSKLLSHVGLLVIAQGVFTMAVLGFGYLLAGHATYLTMGSPSLGFAFRLSLFSCLAMLPLLAVHSWLSSRQQSVGLALGIALVGSLLTVLMIGSGVGAFRWLPWGLAVGAVDFGERGVHGAWGFLTGSLAVSALLMTAGTVDFARREEMR